MLTCVSRAQHIVSAYLICLLNEWGSEPPSSSPRHLFQAPVQVPCEHPWEDVCSTCQILKCSVAVFLLFCGHGYTQAHPWGLASLVSLSPEMHSAILSRLPPEILLTFKTQAKGNLLQSHLLSPLQGVCVINSDHHSSDSWGLSARYQLNAVSQLTLTTALGHGHYSCFHVREGKGRLRKLPKVSVNKQRT